MDSYTIRAPIFLFLLLRCNLCIFVAIHALFSWCTKCRDLRVLGAKKKLNLGLRAKKNRIPSPVYELYDGLAVLVSFVTDLQNSAGSSKNLGDQCGGPEKIKEKLLFLCFFSFQQSNVSTKFLPYETPQQF